MEAIWQVEGEELLKANPGNQAGSQEQANEMTPTKHAKKDSPPPADAFFMTVQVSTIQG